MQAEPKNIVKSIFGRENLLDVSKDEIRKLAEEYPYSPVIQYLLTRRLKISSDAGYGDSVARTAVYFNNPHWLSQLLRRQTTDERMQELEQSLGLNEAAVIQEEPLEGVLEEKGPGEANRERTTEVERTEEDHTDHEASETYEASEGTGETPSTALETVSEPPEALLPLKEDSVSAEEEGDEGAGYLQTLEEELPREETEEADNDDDVSVPKEETADRAHRDVHAAAVSELLMEQALSLEVEEADNDDDTSVPTEEYTQGTPTEVQPMAVPEPLMEQTPSLQEEGMQVTEYVEPMEATGAETTSIGATQEQTEEDEESKAPHVSMPEIVLPDGEPTVAEALGETESVIPIQPMHTMDYFASQGVSLEEEPSMRMDPKAKAFTGWLRAMKPVHPGVDADVPVSADKTDTDRFSHDDGDERVEILTEAMAEVYAKQGLRLKAIDVYRKLSLLHPDKSSIFAAKIDQIKGISS